MNIFGNHKLSILKTIFMFKINSIFHLMKLVSNLLAKLNLVFIIVLKLVLNEF